MQPSDKTLFNLRPLTETNYTIASDDPDVRGWSVVDSTGTTLGHVGELIIDTNAMKVRYFQLRNNIGTDRDNLYAPVEQADLNTARKQVVLRSGGALLNALPGEDNSVPHAGVDRAPSSTGSEAQRLTRAEEEVRVGKRAVQSGEVRIGKHVETERVHEDVGVVREQVHVERRPVTDAHTPTEIRASGEEIRVPIIEEEVVVEKRPVVKEELVINKERVQETRPVDVEVKREEFDIHGDVDATVRDSHRERGGR